MLPRSLKVLNIYYLTLNNRCSMRLRAVNPQRNTMAYNPSQQPVHVMFWEKEKFRPAVHDMKNFNILSTFVHIVVARLVAVLFVSLNDLGDCGPLCPLTFPVQFANADVFPFVPCSFRGRSHKKSVRGQKSARLSRL